MTSSSNRNDKRCLYTVLGLSQDCTNDEIRTAYKKLALQRHPDKLMKSGLSDSEATASFQELVNAYEVLSDVRERAWYDSHRSQILFSGADNKGGGSVPDLFQFFSKSVFFGYGDSGKGFYKVYSDVFDKIYSNELNFANKMGLGVDAVKEAPLMGNLESPYAQVNAFYNYWIGFATVMDFCWTDQYDAMAGQNRKSRRVMEEENKKVRKKARREYNETVTSLAKFVKKRDKRVIDMQLKKNEEMEKKKEEEKKKKMEKEREKLERGRAYKEPEWAKVEDNGEEEDDNEVEDEKNNGAKELFCVVCRKKFKSDKQWKNHEQSKKHKEKVAGLREAFSEEDNEVNEEEEEIGQDENSGIDEVSEKFEDTVHFQDQDNGDEEAQSTDGEANSVENLGSTKVSEAIVSDDDEASILEAMVSGHKSRKNARLPKAKTSTTKTDPTNESEDDMDFMAYNHLKSTRRRRATRGNKGKKDNRDEGEAITESITEVKSQVEETRVSEDDDLCTDETAAHASVEKESNGVEDSHESGKNDISKQHVKKKGTDKKEPIPKPRKLSRGQKQKAASKSSKNSGNVCDTCGEDFESRSQLFKHLGDSGHATLKPR